MRGQKLTALVKLESLSDHQKCPVQVCNIRTKICFQDFQYRAAVAEHLSPPQSFVNGGQKSPKKI
jgi:hypothetical protein